MNIDKNGDGPPKKNEIRIEIRFKNALLWNELRRALRLSETEPLILKEASQFLGVKYHELGRYLNLKKSPWRKCKGGHQEEFIYMRKDAMKILSKLNVPVATVFPPYLYEKPLPLLAAEIPAQRVLPHIHERPILESPEDILLRTEAKERLQSILQTLTPREEQVIKLRFGLGDGRQHTLREIGEMFAVGAERVRLIEAKALRKLRHPDRLKTIRHIRGEIEMPGG